MKVTIEGTIDEIAKAFPHLIPTSASIEVATGGGLEVRSGGSEGTSPGASTVDVDFARRVLTRRPLSNEQRIVLSALYDAHPSWVPISDLQTKVKYTKNQFTGLMGAFGRRVATTPGHVQYTRFFIQEWDPATRAQRYKLADTVLEAMRLEKLN